MGIADPFEFIDKARGMVQVKFVRGKEQRVGADVRVLGTGEFVERSIQEADAGDQRQISLEARIERAREYILKACEEEGISLWQLRTGSRRRSGSRFRSRVARDLVEDLGLTVGEVSRQPGVYTSAIWRAISRSKPEEVNVVKDAP